MELAQERKPPTIIVLRMELSCKCARECYVVVHDKGATEINEDAQKHTLAKVIQPHNIVSISVTCHPRPIFWMTRSCKEGVVARRKWRRIGVQEAARIRTRVTCEEGDAERKRTGVRRNLVPVRKSANNIAIRIIFW